MTRILQTMMAKFWRQKATIRPQNIGLKAAAAKRPHFAHGRFKTIFICCVFVEPEDGDSTEIIDSLDLDGDDVVYVDNDVHVDTGTLDTVEHSDPVGEALSGAIAGKI